MSRSAATGVAADAMGGGCDTTLALSTLSTVMVLPQVSDDIFDREVTIADLLYGTM